MGIEWVVHCCYSDHLLPAKLSLHSHCAVLTQNPTSRNIGTMAMHQPKNGNNLDVEMQTLDMSDA